MAEPLEISQVLDLDRVHGPIASHAVAVTIEGLIDTLIDAGGRMTSLKLAIRPLTTTRSALSVSASMEVPA